MDSNSEGDLESDLLSLIAELIMHDDGSYGFLRLTEWKVKHIIMIIRFVRSIDLDSLPKPESKLMSLVTQTISLFNSLDLDSQPEHDLISFFSRLFNFEGSSSDFKSEVMRNSYRLYTLSFTEPEPELMSLICQILWLVFSMLPKSENIISLVPQVRVKFKEGKFHVVVKENWHKISNKWRCFPDNWNVIELREGEEKTHFLCRNCLGKFHEDYERTPVEVKHFLHPKHSLQLVFFKKQGRTRDCYCCGEDLKQLFYYCSACDFSLNIACVEKPPLLSIDEPKWHEHTLSLFPIHTLLTCDVCALTHSSCPLYICAPCGFVVHQRCFTFPRVIRISRHLHRIFFTPSFHRGDLSCGVCRKRVNNDYGGYSCIKDGCSYAAHSKCATQSNVWDGIDLEGEPEEIEEEVEPFVTISDRIIKHFNHDHHHLRLDENTNKDYDDKLCQACFTPIFFGNFYSCLQCEFILHKACANLSRKIYHPIHPHKLTLSVEKEDVDIYSVHVCSACHEPRVAGFFYKSSKEGCNFNLHVQCATISEPLVHGSHMHPLFLTSKPGEERTCSMCKDNRETFNCIENECDFALCFKCATIPEKVRYKHDKHILTLSYGEKTSQETYWCETCERKINPTKRFYRCDENCCVTLHIECLIGEDLYMRPGSSWLLGDQQINVLPNNLHMSRPICKNCKKRCPQKIAFQNSRSIFCSITCYSTASSKIKWGI